MFGTLSCVLCREVVLILECPLSEAPLHITTVCGTRIFLCACGEYISSCVCIVCECAKHVCIAVLCRDNMYLCLEHTPS